ncbi:MAG: LptA/OstA family protein [Gammaproteobacteria bacterium]
MPDPRPSRRATPLALAVSGMVLAALGLAGVAPARAATGDSTLTNCGKIEIDSKNGGAKFPKGSAGTLSLADVTITVAGCGMEIKAKSAHTTSLDIEDSNWTLDGNVRIKSDQMQSKLSSDQAVVRFRNSEIERITITGNPAEFEQKRADSGLITRGHARQMVYEAGQGTVRLMEDAWLSDGGREIKTPQLVYDIRKAEIRNTDGGDSGSKAASDGSQRMIITIDPKASKKPAATPAAASPNDGQKDSPKDGPKDGKNNASSPGASSAAPAKP